MSTTQHQVVGRSSSSEACEFTGENTLGRETLCFCSGNVASGVDKVGSLFGRVRQKVQETVARARFALQNLKKLSRWEHFWKMRSAKCAPDCSKSSISQKRHSKNLHIWSSWCCGNVVRCGATLLQCRFATGCDKTHWHSGTSKAFSDAATLLQADLQLEVAKRIVTTARREELSCRNYRRASWEAAQSRVREEVAQIRDCSEKELREEVPQRRGCSVKK